MTTLTTHPALDAQKLSVKILIEQGQDIPFETFVPIFHSWIQQQSVAGHLLVDVASYGHVVEGPGIVLIAHEANIGIDEQGGGRGLLYVRKTTQTGSLPERLAKVVSDAWSLARKLEDEAALAGKLKFRANGVSVRVHDRLRAPNTPETFDALRPILGDVLASALGGQVELDWVSDPAKLFEVNARRGQAARNQTVSA